MLVPDNLQKATWGELAERTDGYIGSDLESIAREAAIRTIREDTEAVEMSHFREAIESIRPTITDELREYYEDLEEMFLGETEPPLRRGSRRGFQ